MDKKLKIIGVMSLLMLSFQGLSQADFDGFMSPLDSSYGFDIEDALGMNSIEGDADRLIEGMGEIPADLVASRAWYNPVKYLSGAGSYVTYYTSNAPELRYHNKQKYTSADFAKRKVAWLNALNTNYSKRFNSIQELIDYLTVDINALKDKKNVVQGEKNLKDYLEHMVFAAQEGLKRFIRRKNQLKEKEAKDKIDSLLGTYLPSLKSPKLLADCQADAEQGLNIAIQAKDEQSIAAHRQVLALLDDVEREIMTLKKTNSLQEAVDFVANKIKSLERSQKSSTGNAFDAQIILYRAVQGALQAEYDQELSELSTLASELTKANTIADTKIKQYGSVRQAHIEAKDELIALESNLQRLESSAYSVGQKKLIEDEKLKIKNQHLVLHQLDLKLKEEQEGERRQDRKVDEFVDKLLVKYNSNISKALTEALTKVGAANQSASVKIGMIKNKRDRYQKLSDHEKVVLQLDQKLQEEKLNDPFNMALNRLSMAKIVDVPQALEDVIGAALSKIGMSLDRLDMTTRQKLADDLTFTSGELIKVMEDPRLSEQQKQLQKQVVVKAMLNRNSSLLVSGVTGASTAALETGNAQTIATDIALNKLVNVLVPTTAAPAFDLSAMSY